MAIEGLLADAAMAMVLVGGAALKLVRCAGCEAPFSAPEAILRTFLAEWRCGLCRRRERIQPATTVELRPVDSDLARRHKEILSGWESLAAAM